jgi:hypothetical protein
MAVSAISGLTLSIEKVQALTCPTCNKSVMLVPTEDELGVLANGWAGRCCSVGITVASLSPARTLTAQRQYWVEVETHEL